MLTVLLGSLTVIVAVLFWISFFVLTLVLFYSGFPSTKGRSFFIAQLLITLVLMGMVLVIA